MHKNERGNLLQQYSKLRNFNAVKFTSGFQARTTHKTENYSLRIGNSYDKKKIII